MPLSTSIIVINVKVQAPVYLILSYSTLAFPPIEDQTAVLASAIERASEVGLRISTHIIFRFVCLSVDVGQIHDG